MYLKYKYTIYELELNNNFQSITIHTPLFFQRLKNKFLLTSTSYDLLKHI